MKPNILILYLLIFRFSTVFLINCKEQCLDVEPYISTQNTTVAYGDTVARGSEFRLFAHAMKGGCSENLSTFLLTVSYDGASPETLSFHTYIKKADFGFDTLIRTRDQLGYEDYVVSATNREHFQFNRFIRIFVR